MTQLTNLVQFPGLGLSFHLNRVAFSIGGVHIYWYGVCIAVGLCLALVFAFRHSIEFGVDPDGMVDVILIGVVLGIVSARAYYVAMAPFKYQSIWEMIAIRDGGLAIYGGVIAGFLTAFLFSHCKKLSFWALADCCVQGLFIGQAIGRWGNFMNREAFGGLTDLPWRMRLWVSSTTYVDVHPTFLYESLWNLIGLLLLYFVVSRARRFDGENTCFYFLWYGIGRFWIEGLRTDSLYLFDWTLFGERIRVSQALFFVMVLVSAGALIYQLGIRKADGSGLYVKTHAAAPAAEAAEGKTDPSADDLPTLPEEAAPEAQPSADGLPKDDT